MKYLLFDLSLRDLIHLALFSEEQIVHASIPGRNRELLNALDSFLIEQKYSKEDVRGMMVVVGAGGFTNTRIATVVANTFGYTQQIPLLAITTAQIVHVQSLIPELLQRTAGHYISATYSGVPNITVKKV